ncbi:hypothetical protein HN51_010728 [Arachis hypogaea]|uniref:Pentacotripeptide-repeat region of PRORP domain-containing protein n=2 Tax=Arachis hypogaea TaxID=3818 RepID=A0A445E254_ARAHY|nr:pentatricopeptide repeat-containing protein At1g30610, chloroplastic isoform X1 [Arachis hypogaea]QHO55866.1 Pentatricopeptide repeat-containing protein [Arachis hypogaea]RYR69503.1 hypothetical protein Ahy_A03g016059 [Arachis hypogaea]
MNGNYAASASALHYAGNSFSSPYAVPISSRTFFVGNALNSSFSRRFHAFHVRKLNFEPVSASLNGGGGGGSDGNIFGLVSDLEFKPSFDEYLKVMESARARPFRGKEHSGSSAAAATTQKHKEREKGMSRKPRMEGGRGRDKRFPSVEESDDDDDDDGFEGSREGYSRSKIRRSPIKGFRKDYDGKGSNLVENVRDDRWLKHKSQSFSLGQESDEYNMSNNQGKSRSGRINNNIPKSNLNSSRGSSIEKGVTHELYSSKISGEKVASTRQSDYRTQGKALGGDKIVAGYEVMDSGIERRHNGVESFINRNGRENAKVNRGSKRYFDKDYDSDDLELDRAAFRSIEESDKITGKQQFSHKAMEERIQNLAKLLNGADINLAEWMFSKMMRSAKIKFNDYSITRVIIILGKLGNWRRVIQVIEWLQKRERFKSHKLRHIYTAALDALGKSRRPVEALNVFHEMQQQMSSYPDLVAYHSIAITLGQAGHMKELFDVIDIMRAPPKKKFKTGPLEKWDPRLEPDLVVYNAILNACIKREQWEGAFWVLQQLKDKGLQPTATTYGLVMEVMFACGKYNLVHEFFRKLQKSCIPNSLTYRVLVNALWKEGKTDEAVLAVQEMEKRGIVGSASLYYDLARCLCAAGRSREALMQIDKICKVANKPLVVTYTGLMQASLDSGNIQDGAYIFEKMKKICAPNLVTCNIMLKGYLENGMFREAKEMFEQMLENTDRLRNNTDYKMLVIPDIYTFNIMLDACAAEKRWDDFQDIYQRMLYHGFYFNPKRHLRMVLEASRAGKEKPLEITWKHLNDTDRVPPASMVKERFCAKLEKDDYLGALSCITNIAQKDLEPFYKSWWLNLFKENSKRFQKGTLVRLMDETNNIVSNNSIPNPALVHLLQSCREMFLDTDHNSVKTVVGEGELVSRPL